VTPADRRTAVQRLQAQFAVSERRAARLVGISRATVRDQQRGAAAQVLDRLRAWEVERPRCGYRRLHSLLRREGQRSNHTRVDRLDRAAGLAVRRRVRTRVARSRVDRPASGLVPHARWTLACMRDALGWERRIRVLAVLDTCPREALAIEVHTSLPSAALIRVLEQVSVDRGQPVAIVMDTGPELTRRRLEHWADERGSRLRVSEPGKPIQHAVMERVNGR
jgi:putative transposase